MRKLLLIFTIFAMTYGAFAQIDSGTIVVFNLTKNKLIVATDSRAVHDNSTPPDNLYCKISALRNQFVFVTLGSASYTREYPSAPIQSWSNTEIAMDAIRSVTTKGGSSSYLNDVATAWQHSVTERWQALCGTQLRKCRDVVKDTHGIITDGIFIEAATKTVNGVEITLVEGPSPTLQWKTGMEFSTCSPCFQSRRSKICALGDHVDVAVKVCSRKHQNHIKVRTKLPKGMSEDVLLPVSIVESAVDIYDNGGTGTVGGPVDVLEIDSKGTIRWLAKKPNCPENLD